MSISIKQGLCECECFRLQRKHHVSIRFGVRAKSNKNKNILPISWVKSLVEQQEQHTATTYILVYVLYFLIASIIPKSLYSTLQLIRGCSHERSTLRLFQKAVAYILIEKDYDVHLL